MAKKIPKIVKEIRNNPPEDINYAIQKHISYSQLSMYKQCPHRWKLHYKDKISQREPSIYMIFGTAIHESIQNYLTVLYEESKAAANRLDLVDDFQTIFMEEYSKQYKKNNKTHFSDAVQMREFFEDGVEILNFLKKKVGGYFSRKNSHLVGIELPVIQPPNKFMNNILYTGYLDLVIYNEVSDTFDIIDIKTSTRGWTDRMKKDEDKQFQLILYKQYFSEQYNIPLDKINIKYFIVKRKLWEESDWPQSRIQEFSPASGKIKLGKAKKSILDFISSVFDSNGKIKDQKYPCKCGQCQTLWS